MTTLPTDAPPDPTGPFTPGDPLAYDELTDEQRSWRALLHVLAFADITVAFPAQYAPDVTTIAIAAGWRYQPTYLADPTGGDIRIGAEFRRTG